VTSLTAQQTKYDVTNILYPPDHSEPVSGTSTCLSMEEAWRIPQK